MIYTQFVIINIQNVLYTVCSFSSVIELKAINKIAGIVCCIQ